VTNAVDDPGGPEHGQIIWTPHGWPDEEAEQIQVDGEQQKTMPSQFSGVSNARSINRSVFPSVLLQHTRLAPAVRCRTLLQDDVAKAFEQRAVRVAISISERVVLAVARTRSLVTMAVDNTARGASGGLPGSAVSRSGAFAIVQK
jgi:hypothetical protein